MLEAAKQENQDADRLSFTGLFPDPASAAARVPEFHAGQTRAVVSFAVGGNSQGAPGGRRNRINPRMVGSKMSKFAKKRPA